jgi:hypothetical protein
MDESVWYGLLILNAVALVGTAFLMWRTRRFLARASRTQGTVTRVTMTETEMMSYGADHPARTDRDYTAHVAFPLEDGSQVEFASRESHSSQPTIGKAVTVVYDRANPAGSAEIEGPAVWRSAIWAGLGTAVLLIATLSTKACS